MRKFSKSSKNDRFKKGNRVYKSRSTKVKIIDLKTGSPNEELFRQPYISKCCRRPVIACSSCRDRGIKEWYECKNCRKVCDVDTYEVKNE